MSREVRRTNNGSKHMDSIRKIAQEVRTWPQWKRELGGFRSNYPSELQPFQGEVTKETSEVKPS